MGRGRPDRLSAVEQHNDMTLPTTGATADKSEKVSKKWWKSWNIADKLVISTTIMQLPAMVGQSIVEWYKGEAMAKAQKEQHEENLQLAKDQ